MSNLNRRKFIKTSSLGAIAASTLSINCQNNLNLLEKFEKKSVIFGSVAIASSRIETEDEIINRINS